MRRFDFRHDVHIDGFGLDESAQLLHVVGITHEGNRQIVEVVGDRPFQIGDVFFRQRVDLQIAVGKIDPFTASDDSTNLTLADKPIVIRLNDHEPNHAVIDQDAMTDLDILQHVGLIGRNARRISLDIFGDDPKPTSGFDGDTVIFDRTKTNFRAAKIPHDCDGQLIAGSDGPNPFDHDLVIVKRSVRKVDPNHVNTGKQQWLEHFRRR